MKIFFSFVLFLSTLAFAQSTMNMKQFEGKWQLQSNDNTFEQWTIVNDSLLTGTGFMIDDQKNKKVLEHLYIQKAGSHYVYIAAPNGQIPALFVLVSSEQNQFVFENPEHDFPQRIIYKFISDSNLEAVIEGIIGEELQRTEFKFIRTE